MVSSSQVMSDASSFSSSLSKYMSLISELASSWKGQSYDNFVSKSNEFYSSFSSSMESQMSSFSESCSLYEKYRTAKSNYNISMSNYNSAVSSNSSDALKYQAYISQYKKEMDDLKGQIESALSSVCSVKLEASSAGAVSSGTSTSINLRLGSGAASNMVNAALAEIGNSEGNNSHHKYEVANGLSDDQPWCAAFVSWVADQNNISTDVFPRFVGCTTGLRQFKEAGATVHYEGDGYNPQAGDIVFYSWSGNPNDLDHVGIVKSYDSNYVYAIEGNTSAEGEAANMSSGGDCVSEKQRSRSNGTIIAYVTPNY